MSLAKKYLKRAKKLSKITEVNIDPNLSWGVVSVDSLDAGRGKPLEVVSTHATEGEAGTQVAKLRANRDIYGNRPAFRAMKMTATLKKKMIVRMDSSE
jgi:hypothetical protein